MASPKRKHIVITKGALYGLIIAYVSVFVVAFVAIQYSNYVDRKSNQRWCSIITTLDDTYKQQPPSTVLGKKLAKDMHELRSEFEC